MKSKHTKLCPLEFCQLFVCGEEPLYSFDVLFSFEAREVVEVDLRFVQHPTQ